MTPALAEIERGFRAWYDSHPRDVGNQTRSVLGRPGPLKDAAAAYQAANPGGAGNGSLMRTGPVALAHLGDRPAIARRAAEVCELTHPHADCVDACVLWSLAIDQTIREAPTTGPYDFAQAITNGLEFVPEDRRRRWAELIDTSTNSSPRRFENNGWVIEAFQAALAAIVSTPVPDDLACTHLELSLATAVRSGGDTDTVAAIAGSLLGARWGATALPLRWRRRLHGRRTYDTRCLQAADLDMLARLAAKGGAADKIGWPGVERLIPYYRASFSSDPMLVEIEGATFGNAAAVPVAIEAGADTVISLCRMGTADVPAGIDHAVIGLLDTNAADNPNLLYVLTDVADTIADDVAAGRHVYVHCVASENRTPAVAAAYLIRHCGHSVDSALATVEKALGRRPRSFLVEALANIACGCRWGLMIETNPVESAKAESWLDLAMVSEAMAIATADVADLVEHLSDSLVDISAERKEDWWIRKVRSSPGSPRPTTAFCSYQRPTSSTTPDTSSPTTERSARSYGLASAATTRQHTPGTTRRSPGSSPDASRSR